MPDPDDHSQPDDPQQLDSAPPMPAVPLELSEQADSVTVDHEMEQAAACAAAAARPRLVKRKSFRSILIFISMFIVTLPMTVLIAFYYREQVVRQVFIWRLSSDDLDARAAAVEFLAVNGQKDPKLLAMALPLLKTGDAETRQAVRLALLRGGLWGPQLGDCWLDHLQQQVDAGSKHPAVQANMLGRLAWKGHPTAQKPRVLKILKRLLVDKDPDARLNALVALSMMPGDGKWAFIEQATADAHWQVATEAWLLLAVRGQCDPATLQTLRQQASALPETIELARAILLAYARLADQPRSLLLAVASDETLPQLLRADAIWLLASDADSQVRQRLIRCMDQATGAPGDRHLLPAWRAVLSVRATAAADDPGLNAIIRLGRRAAAYESLYLDRVDSAVDPQQYRRAVEQAAQFDGFMAAVNHRVVQTLQQAAARPAPDAADVRSPWSVLGAPGAPAEVLKNQQVRSRLESALPHSIDWSALGYSTGDDSRHTWPSRFPAQWSKVNRALACRAAMQSEPSDLHRVFTTESSSDLNVSLLAALDGLDREQLTVLSRVLVNSLSEHERMAGALLIGLAGLDDQPLDRWLTEDKTSPTHCLEQDWQVLQYEQLAKLMLGRDAHATQTIERLKARVTTDVAWDTLVLMLVASGHLEGLDMLFTPFEDIVGVKTTEQMHQVPIWQVLGRLRLWWSVRRYLPPELHDAYWTYADAYLQQFQWQVLRSWYVVHRRDLSYNAEVHRYELKGVSRP